MKSIRRRAARPRRGVALVAAIALLALLSILIAGGFAAVTASGRAADLSSVESTLSAAADRAVGDALANSAPFVDLPLGVATPVVVPATEAATQLTASVTRLPHGVLWLVGDARLAGSLGGRRRFGLVARFAGPVALPPAPLVAGGGITARDGVTIVADTSHDPECAAPSAPWAAAPTGAATSLPDGAAIQVAAAASDSASYYFGESIWRGAGSGVTRASGDTSIAGGTFNGVLLVNGSLRVDGPFTVNGLIVARGSVTAVTGALDITGAIMALGQGQVPAIHLVGATVRFAPCLIARAFRAAFPARPVRERSWAELY